MSKNVRMEIDSNSDQIFLEFDDVKVTIECEDPEKCLRWAWGFVQDIEEALQG